VLVGTAPTGRVVSHPGTSFHPGAATRNSPSPAPVTRLKVASPGGAKTVARTAPDRVPRIVMSYGAADTPPCAGGPGSVLVVSAA
jgi:hypothetical protein